MTRKQQIEKAYREYYPTREDVERMLKDREEPKQMRDDDELYEMAERREIMQDLHYQYLENN